MTAGRIEVTNRPDLDPVCPHCETKLRRVWMKELSSALGRRYVYFCSDCQKVLGVSHRKGFWMG